MVVVDILVSKVCLSLGFKPQLFAYSLSAESCRSYTHIPRLLLFYTLTSILPSITSRELPKPLSEFAPRLSPSIDGMPVSGTVLF